MQRCDIATQHCLQIPAEAIAAFKSTNKTALWNQQEFLRGAPIPSLEAEEEQALQEQWVKLLLWHYQPARRWDIAFACAPQTLKETPALSLMVYHCPASEHSTEIFSGLREGINHHAATCHLHCQGWLGRRRMDLTKSNSHSQTPFVSKHQHLPQAFGVSFLYSAYCWHP